MTLHDCKNDLPLGLLKIQMRLQKRFCTNVQKSRGHQKTATKRGANKLGCGQKKKRKKETRVKRRERAQKTRENVGR